MSNEQYSVMTNTQSPSGKWTVFADDLGTVVGLYSDPDDVRSHLCYLGLTTVAMDVDGNGSFAQVPVEWIGDGESIVLSERAMKLIE